MKQEKYVVYYTVSPDRNGVIFNYKKLKKIKNFLILHASCFEYGSIAIFRKSPKLRYVFKAI
jgi:hypothetical protein